MIAATALAEKIELPESIQPLPDLNFTDSGKGKIMMKRFLNLVVCAALTVGAISCGGAGKRLAKEEIKARKFFRNLEKNFEKLSDGEKDKYCCIMAEDWLAEDSDKLMKQLEEEEECRSKRLQKINEKLDELRKKSEEEEYERRMRDPEEKKLEQLLNDAKMVSVGLVIYCDNHDGNLPVGLDDDDLIKEHIVDKKIAEQFRMLDLPQKITEIENHSETVMFVSKKGIRGRFVVGYADGHCVILQESDLPK